MNTEEIMDMALALAGLETVPSDSGIFVPGENICSVMFGVDMATPELLLARQAGVDLVISHHPQGDTSTVEFHKVMERQIDCMVRAGIPINKAQKALKETKEKVARSSHAGNYDRTVSAARLLGIPFMNIHMPADIITENYVQAYLDREITDPRATLGEVTASLKKIPEYSNAVAGPVIRVGSESDFAGKIMVLMAGGTNGGEKVFKAYFEAGVGTIVCMHVPDDVRKAVIEQNIGNIIVAGHMASDSIGINIIIRELEKRGLTVTRMCGVTGGAPLS
ncbi:MAG: hypothetical protein ACOX8W_11440 [bacterium]|jgi:hypothetical protein